MYCTPVSGVEAKTLSHWSWEYSLWNSWFLFSLTEHPESNCRLLKFRDWALGIFASPKLSNVQSMQLVLVNICQLVPMYGQTQRATLTMLKADCDWRGRHRPMHRECNGPRNRKLYLKGQCHLWEHSKLAVDVNMAFKHGIWKAAEWFCNMVFINIDFFLMLAIFKNTFLQLGGRGTHL